MREQSAERKILVQGVSLRSERGSILIGVMVASLMIAASAAYVLHDALQASKLSRLPRLKAEMVSVENQVRELAHSPTTYENCQVIESGDAAPKNCAIKAGVFNELARRVTGALCDVADCGIIIDEVALSPAGMFSARVNYKGREQSLVGLVNIQVPREVLQASNYVCPDARPLFKGFDAEGKLICAPLNGNLCNGPGQYVAAVNPLTLAVERCGTLPPVVTCPDGEILSQYTWDGSGTQTATCSSRLDPFAYFDFDPGVVMGGPAVMPIGVDPVAPAAFSILDRFVPKVPPPPPLPTDPINCVGAYGTCEGGGCGFTGIKTYAITVAADNGGTPCPHNDGDTDSCNLGPCPPPSRDCVGSYGACVGACGGMGTQTYTWTTTPENGGANCAIANGATQACPTDPCPPEDCIGSWSACSQLCSTAGSVGTQTYTVNQPATGAGLACPAANGATQTCNNLPCPVVGRWCLQTPGDTYCGGNPINPSAACDPLTAGMGHVNNPGCGTGVFQTDVYTCVDAADACPPVGAPPPPPGGDCTYNLPISWNGPGAVFCFSMPLEPQVISIPNGETHTEKGFGNLSPRCGEYIIKCVDGNITTIKSTCAPTWCP